MLLKNSLIYINQFFFFIFTELRKIYLKSNIYNNKISKIDSNHLDYKPSPSLLDGIIKYSKNRKNISDFSLNNVWSENKVLKKDFKKFHDLDVEELSGIAIMADTDNSKLTAVSYYQNIFFSSE